MPFYDADAMVTPAYKGRMSVLYRAGKPSRDNCHSVDFYSNLLGKAYKEAETVLIFDFAYMYFMRKAWECLQEPNGTFKTQIGHIKTKLKVRQEGTAEGRPKPARASNSGRVEEERSRNSMGGEVINVKLKDGAKLGMQCDFLPYVYFTTCPFLPQHK